MSGLNIANLTWNVVHTYLYTSSKFSSPPSISVFASALTSFFAFVRAGEFCALGGGVPGDAGLLEADDFLKWFCTRGQAVS